MATRFFVRIQLHDVLEPSVAYLLLHDAMAERGFKRTIVVDGQERKLPWGTYIGQAADTGVTKDEAAKRVADAAKVIKQTASFVVLETETGIMGNNLEPAEQPKSALEELRDLFKTADS